MLSLPKKTAIVLALLMLPLGVYLYLAAPPLKDINSLLVCSQGNDEITPKFFCQTYLFTFGISRKDVALLNRSAGVSWIMHAADSDDREKLLSFLLKSGVDINAIDVRSGISALHAFVLENNYGAVSLLLKYGANPNITDASHGKTALQLAQDLSVNPTQPDRTKIMELLQSESINQK